MSQFVKDYRGLSLVEVLVAMGIFVVFIFSIVQIFLFSNKSKDIVFDQLAAQGQGRKVVQDFVNELRSAAYSSVGAYPLAVASSTQIIFYSNIDSDSSVEKIRYFYASSTLKKGVTKPTGNPLGYSSSTESVSTLVENVKPTSTIFYYYGQSYVGSSGALIGPVSIGDVRMVEIILTLDRDPYKSPVPIVVDAKTAVRNLKSN